MHHHNLLLHAFAMLLAGSTPFAAMAEDYPINYALNATISGTRSLNAVKLSSPVFGIQSVNVPQASDRLLYHNSSDKLFVAAPGEKVSVTFDFAGQWMHGYVYLDRGNDGQFSYTLGDNSAIPEGSDVMAFSNYNQFNSAGEKTFNQNVGVNPPAFIIPSDLQPGLYRMRFKIDWNSIDPGGNDANGTIHQQLITANGGSITDITVMVTNGERTLTLNADHGSVTLADGSPLTLEAITQGQPLTIKFCPDQSYALASVSVESGFEMTAPDGHSFADGIGTKSSISAIGALIHDNTFTIPGYMTVGPITINADFRENGNEPEEGEYEPSLSGPLSGDGFTGFTLNGSHFDVSTDQRHYFNDQIVAVEKGNGIQLSADYSGNADHFTLLLDCNNNGVFSKVQGEDVATSTSASFETIYLPEELPCGIYRARLIAEDDCEIEFLLNYHATEVAIDSHILNGIALGANSSPLGNTVQFGKSFTTSVRRAVEGFDASEFTIRHGYNLDGPQYIHGNRQWEELVLEVGNNVAVPAEAVDGSVLITADFEESPESEWTAIWSDEFDGDDLNSDNWQYHPRYSSTWNKRVATTAERPYVNKFRNGHYESYAIATPEEFTSEQQNIITGAIYSHNRFYLTGGIIECRLRTRGHAGNFPAYWMMPVQSKYGWPKDGEIDIWEQIDDSFTTYHTIHSGWTYKSFGAVSRNSPQSSGSTVADPNTWHVYTLEWDPEEYLKWYVDGKLVFTYKNQHWSEGSYTEEITWPFDKAFYVILNQSVGDGSWAKDGDATFEYLTEFDYVRAYQKKNNLNYFTTETGLVTATPDIICDDSADFDGEAVFYNIQGIRVDSSALTPGIYIEKRGSKTRKIAVY